MLCNNREIKGARGWFETTKKVVKTILVKCIFSEVLSQ